ncbi:MAG TPA: cellulase family glycosylhydrolase [Anaeromyxobacter sp.]|nr:cellulase family glycosylhydrolase [Anaeromyxobacter sp.]
MSTQLRLVAAALALALAAPAAAQLRDARDHRARSFVQRHGRELRHGGQPFRVAGASNYYLMYKSRRMVDDVLETAAASGFNVIRTWGSLDIGNQDGSNSIRGKQEGVYFQYWDGTAPAFNDGPDGLEHLDYVIAKAGEVGVRLIIPFVNNWNDFGGMDQYVRWRGGRYHDEFYTDPVIRGWYKAWIAHLLERVNPLTGIKYKDDPTILVWELANEPRCQAYGAYPTSPACNTQTLLAWADDVSRYVKRLDRNHMVATGDEGFLCVPGATDWTEDCSTGVDAIALADLPAIDLVSFHLYPDHWGKTDDPTFGKRWIERHIREARRIREKAMLGEFGIKDKATRNVVYKEWTDTVLLNGGAGALYWMLAGKQDDGSLYPDYDGFTVYCPSPVCTAFGNFADLVLRRGPYTFPPVADHDEVETAAGAPVLLRPTANDVTYWLATLVPGSLDLDPAAAGVQTTLATAAGTFTVQPGDEVLFTPADGFSGNARASYVVADDRRRSSNPATLTVNVKPPPDAGIRLFSFEDGAEGWGPIHAGSGTVAQTAAFATAGAHGLEVAVATGDWFGLHLPQPASFGPYTRFRVDVQTLDAGTSLNLALQLGDGWTWCQGTSWPWQNASTTARFEVDLATLDCGITDFSSVRALWLFLGPGVHRIDDVRVE